MIVIGQHNNHSIGKGFMNPESGKGSTSPEFTGLGKGSSEAQLRYTRAYKICSWASQV